MHARLCIVSSVEATMIRVQYHDVVYVDFVPETETDPQQEVLHEDSATKVFKLGEGTYGVLRFSYDETEPFTITVEGDEQALVTQVKKENLAVMRSVDVESVIASHYVAFNNGRVDQDVFPH